MHLSPNAAVATPEVIGILAWWGVLLAAPLFLLRRITRRRRVERWSDFRGSVIDDQADVTALPGGATVESAGLPAGAEARSEAARLGATAARLPPSTLEPLCRYVDFRRRLELAVAELERRLAALPWDRWRIEPYPLTGERRNTLLVLGETGVFVIAATYAPGHWDDVVTVSTLAGKIQQLLPGYAGQVHPAICHPFTSLPPRDWHRADEHGDWVGAWLVGGNSVIEWLAHFGTEHGLGPGDLERFEQLAKPNWMNAAIPAPPSWPPTPDTATRGPLG